MVHVKHLRSIKALIVNFQSDFQGPLPKWPFCTWLKKWGLLNWDGPPSVPPSQHAITPLEPTHLPLFCWEGIPHPKKCASKNVSTRNAQLRRQNPSITSPPKPSNRTTGRLHPVVKVWSSELWGSDDRWWLSFNPFAKDAQSSKLKHETPKFGVKI